MIDGVSGGLQFLINCDKDVEVGVLCLCLLLGMQGSVSWGEGGGLGGDDIMTRRWRCAASDR